MWAGQQRETYLGQRRAAVQAPVKRARGLRRKGIASKSSRPDFSFLSGGGEMGGLIRAFDWSKTPIGGPADWSPALKTMLQIMLANRFPHILWWGPEYVQFYNDPYRPIPGTKHPKRVLGQRGCDCWSEIWHVIGPLVDRPFRGGPATWDEDILLEVHRHGFTEETHFTIAYSPVPDETALGGIGGVLATVHEITQKVVGERRVVALRDLGARLTDGKSAGEVCEITANTLAGYEKDIPFALLYLRERDGRQARLAGTVGVDAGKFDGTVEMQNVSESHWPFAAASETGEMQLVNDLDRCFAIKPKGPWSDSPSQAVMLTLPSSKPEEPAGFIVVGVSARLRFDQFYADFFELVRTQIATAIANARAYEEERKRAEALAEIDRAKTVFFNNVSHEFRTPLTLLLGPAEEMLKHGGLSLEAAQQVEVIHRNALRLQRLVNTLLDFSRIEAGRIKGVYTATDLSAVTTELASVFRAAMEKGGLKFIVELTSLEEPVFVDREMWEKIVFNLLSNAFKFTLDGEVRVSLRSEGRNAVLRVSDTGIGIPGEEIENVFNRFYRVEGRRGRTHEGTGIGLALVQELVKLHSGTISVQSEAGQGTTFEVRLPFGKDHLPAEHLDAGRNVEPRPTVGSAFVEETLTWLPEHALAKSATAEPTKFASDGSSRPRIVLAEDNADMRNYARRLLEPSYAVEAVSNGALALEAARRDPPDLILSDVMMAEMNGLELLSAVRADGQLQMIPVVLLSARAGEEARIEGAAQLADDYIIKPFSARELLARIDTQIRLARARAKAENAAQKEIARRKKVEKELRRAQQELSHHAAGLEKEVGVRTASLREAMTQLEEFSYSVSHDLRAPLRAISGYNFALREDCGASLPPVARTYLEKIGRNAERMERLVNDLLTFSRVARVDLQLHTIPLQQYIEDIREQNPSMQEPAAEMTIEAPHQVMADEAPLGQAISNLLSNGVKFVTPGDKPVVRVRSEQREKRVRIWVEDSGIGIAPQYRQQLFGMFQRLPAKKDYEGTGIGLAIARKAVERMGGSVGMEPNEPSGCRFWIELKGSS
jgi:signal transduction histidine kinase